MEQDNKKKYDETSSPIMKEGNISIITDSYDDLFSDFDPRHFSERALSDDFLFECKNAVRGKDGKSELELRILVPEAKRKLSDEVIIKKRLKNHFQKHFNEKTEELSKIKKEGFLWFILGVALATMGAYIYDYKTILTNFALVMLEPAGWFTMWTGLDKIFSNIKDKHPEFEFYKKMSNVRIIFYSY